MAKTASTVLKKLPAVRLIVKDLGVEASVAEVRDALKEKYNFDMTDSVAQNYVSKARRELRNDKGRAKRAKAVMAAPASAPAPVVHVEPKPMGNGAAVGHVVEAVTTLKGLAGSLGKDNLLKLVEAM